MDSILIFGGGINQLTLIESAKELGYRTIVIDPIESVPAKQVADIFECVDPKDYDKTKELALKYGVKGIVTCQMENPLLLMAKLATELNFIFPTEKAVLNARNKFLMKECFIKSNVPCAKGKLVKSGEKITSELCNEIGFPLIIKPVDSFSSRGVYKVNRIEEIESYLSNTKSFSSNGDVIIEEFMDGPEVSVESVTQNGVTTMIQITDKVITPYPTAVEMAHIQPSFLSKEIKDQITELVKKAIVALELDNCASHAEVKITTKGIKMVELGARLGGDYITSHLVPLSTGINIEAAAIQIAMGKKPDLKKKFSKGAVIEYILLEPGKKISEIKDWRNVKVPSAVKQAFVFCKAGDVVSPVTDSAKRAACVIVQADNRKGAVEIAQLASEELKDKISLS